MEGNGRRLAWIAIALSAVALVVSLGGRMGPRMQGYWGPGGYGMQGQFGQQGQFNPQQGPQGQFNPQQGPQGRQGFQGGMRGMHGPGFQNNFRQQGQPGPRGIGPWMFFLPFMLFGTLIKLAFVVLLVWLGLRLLRGRGNGGRWGRGGGAPPSSPGPEQEPYTGDTTQI